jgi:2-polyprenyl-3-methyl-5-hydroxy-6-metoxy-1,4-benzoquinol methylase
LSSTNDAAFYDQVWTHFGDLDAASPAAFHRRRQLLGLVRRHAPSARRLLEVGCGQGALLETLSLELPSALLHGADVSPAALARARSACRDADLFLLDLAGIDFDGEQQRRFGRFDLVICSEVLEHLADDALALSRIAKLLEPGGHLIVSVPSGQPTRFDRAIGHLRHYQREKLGHLLVGAGFELQRIVAWGFPFHNLYRLAVAAASRLTLAEGGAERVPAALLGPCYRLLGMALKPLYYLNRPYCGTQLFAVARKL